MICCMITTTVPAIDNHVISTPVTLKCMKVALSIMCGGENFGNVSSSAYNSLMTLGLPYEYVKGFGYAMCLTL